MSGWHHFNIIVTDSF